MLLNKSGDDVRIEGEVNSLSVAANNTKVFADYVGLLTISGNNVTVYVKDVDRVVLYDTDARRLDAMMAVLSSLDFPHSPTVRGTTDMNEALPGADFVFSAMRVLPSAPSWVALRMPSIAAFISLMEPSSSCDRVVVASAVLRHSDYRLYCGK